MKAVVQRVRGAAVSVEGREIGRIGPGLLVFLGVAQGDTEREVDFLAKKVLNLRIFPDENDKMNLSVLDLGYGLLVISQFTLLGDCRKGNRPNFMGAAPPDLAKRLYETFVGVVSEQATTATGEFGAMMEIEALNHGPVTIILETPPAAQGGAFEKAPP